MMEQVTKLMKDVLHFIWRLNSEKIFKVAALIPIYNPHNKLQLSKVVVRVKFLLIALTINQTLSSLIKTFIYPKTVLSARHPMKFQ